MMTAQQFDQTTADISTEITAGVCATRQPMVSVTVTRDMARLLARLQQLRKTGARVLVDMENLTLEVCGKAEKLR